jgi:hypothetical protein
MTIREAETNVRELARLDEFLALVAAYAQGNRGLRYRVVRPLLGTAFLNQGDDALGDLRQDLLNALGNQLVKAHGAPSGPAEHGALADRG